MRDITSFIVDRNRSDADKKKITKLDCAFLVVWVTALSVISVFTFDGFWSLFAYFATLAFTVSIWQKKVFVYKTLGILVGVCWIIYNVAIQSLFGVVLESVLLGAVVVGIVLYLRKRRASGTI